MSFLRCPLPVALILGTCLSVRAQSGYTDFNVLQIEVNLQTAKNWKAAETRFKAKYRNGISADQYNSFIATVKACEDHYRIPASQSQLFDTVVNHSTDIFLPSGLSVAIPQLLAVAPFANSQLRPEPKNNDTGFQVAQSQLIATVLKAEQYNDNAIVQIHQRIEYNNSVIQALELSADELKKNGLDYSDPVKKISDLTIQNEMNLNVLAAATAPATTSVTKAGGGVTKVEGDIVSVRPVLTQDGIVAQWKNISLGQEINTLKTSDKYDALFGYSPGAKDSAIQQYSAVLFRQQVSATISDVAQYGGVAVDAMKTFHIGSKQLQAGLNYAVQGIGIIGDLYSGNYATALKNIIGLFGGGASPEQQMLQQIQKQINSLQKDMDAQFNAVREDLDSLAAHIDLRFDRIEKDLYIISSQLDEMRDENERNFAYIRNQLAILKNQSDCLQQSVQRLASPFIQCGNSYQNSGNDNMIFLDTLKQNMRNYGNCIDNLNIQFGPILTGNDNAIFNYTSCDQDFKLDNLYYSVVRMWNENLYRVSKPSGGEDVSFLLYPAKDARFTNLYQRSVLANPANFTDPVFSSAGLLKLGMFTEPATHYKSSAAICTLGAYFLRFLPYLVLYDPPNHRLIDDPAKVTAKQVASIESWIEEQVEVCNLSIAQHMLYDGNFITGQVGDILLNEPLDRNVHTLFRLLNHNPVFQKNLAYTLVHSAFKDTTDLNSYLTLAKTRRNDFFSVADPSLNWLQLYSDTAGALYFNIQTTKPVVYNENNLTDRKVLHFLLPVPAAEYKLGLTSFQIDDETAALLTDRRLLIQKLVEFDLFKTLKVSDNNNIDQQDLLYLLRNTRQPL